MKLQIASDLHLEYAPDWELPAGDADVLVLAGDVAIQTHGLAAFRARARQQPVLYVPGNHEYYCGNYSRVAAALRARARQWGITRPIPAVCTPGLPATPCLPPLSRISRTCWGQHGCGFTATPTIHSTTLWPTPKSCATRGATLPSN